MKDYLGKLILNKGFLNHYDGTKIKIKHEESAAFICIGKFPTLFRVRKWSLYNGDHDTYNIGRHLIVEKKMYFTKLK
jgi:hypothetical protein